MNVELPQLEFRYLICTFLPAVPLSSILFCTWIDSLEEVGFSIFLFWAIFTLLIGLILDVGRHFVERFRWPPKVEIDFQLYEFTANFTIAGVLGLLILVTEQFAYQVSNPLQHLWFYISLLVLVAMSGVFAWWPGRSLWSKVRPKLE